MVDYTPEEKEMRFPTDFEVSHGLFNAEWYCEMDEVEDSDV